MNKRLQERRARILELLRERGDPESRHMDADNLLLEIIGDQEITDAWAESRFWYA